MTQTPQQNLVQPRFATRPTPPAAGSAEEDRWARDSTIPFPGGYIKSAYGNLVQTWNTGNVLASCTGLQVNRAGYSVTRTNKIGGTSKTVNYSATTYSRFPGRNGSSAAGGEVWTFITDLGSYKARVGGDVQTVLKFLCEQQVSQFGTLEVVTSSGKTYGPFAHNN